MTASRFPSVFQILIVHDWLHCVREKATMDGGLYRMHLVSAKNDRIVKYKRAIWLYQVTRVFRSAAIVSNTSPNTVSRVPGI